MMCNYERYYYFLEFSENQIEIYPKLLIFNSDGILNHYNNKNYDYKKKLNQLILKLIHI